MLSINGRAVQQTHLSGMGWTLWVSSSFSQSVGMLGESRKTIKLAAEREICMRMRMVISWWYNSRLTAKNIRPSSKIREDKVAGIFFDILRGGGGGTRW